MQRRKRNLAVAFAIIAGLESLLALPAAAQTPDPHQIDPHAIYEGKCAACHPAHAGEFVRARLFQSDGRLAIQGSSRDLQTFLQSGHGKLTPEETGLLIEQFRQILMSGGLFQRKCRVCHDRAVEFARLNLIEKDGRLTGRYSHRDVADFLQNHGRLEKDEIDTMIGVLKRELH